MQTFKQKKIALAVGATLLTMAGGAQALVTAPVQRTAKPMLTVQTNLVGGAASATAARSLYNGEGFTGTLNVQLNFTVAASTLTTAPNTAFTTEIPQVTAGNDGFKVNGLVYNEFTQVAQAATTGQLALAYPDNDVSIYYISATGALTPLSVGNLGFTTNVAGTTQAGATTAATAAVMLDSGTGAFRLSALGALEYVVAAADRLVGPWLPVKLAVHQSSASNGIIAHDRQYPSVEALSLSYAQTGAATTLVSFWGTAVGLSAATTQVSFAGNAATIAAIAAQDIFSSVIPTPIISTRATGGLIDGVTFDTLTPLSAGFTAATVKVSTVTGVAGADQNVALPATIGTPTSSFSLTLAAAGSTTTAAVPSAKYPIIITTPATADWTTGNAAADALVYNDTNFHTGINGTNVLAFQASFVNSAAGVSYAAVYDKSTGLLATPAAINMTAATVLDGAPAVLKATGGISFGTVDSTTGLTDLTLTFSEPMSEISVASLLADRQDALRRELLENISVGTAGANGATTLAALSLNSGTAVGAVTGTGTKAIVLPGVTATDIATYAAATGLWTGKSLTVGTGVSLKEPNDTGYSSTLAAIDSTSGTGAYGEELGGGLKTTSLGTVADTLQTAQTQTAVVPPLTIAWGTDTTADASASSAASPDLIDTITVTFAAGKGVKLSQIGATFGSASALTVAKTTADLAAALVIDVHGTNGLTFQVHPTTVGGTAATATGGTTLTITLPTALIYSKLAAANSRLHKVYVGYVTGGANSQNNALMSSDAVASPLATAVAVAAGTAKPTGATIAAELAAAGAEPVTLPLVFTSTQTGGQSTLLTQNIQSNVVGGTTGSKVSAYLAYWADAATSDSAAVVSGDIKSGRITNPLDKVATDLAIEFADQTALAANLQTALRAIKAGALLKPGLADKVTAAPSKPIPVYVKLVRTNDAQLGYGNVGTGISNASNSNVTTQQGMLMSRAILASTYAAAKAAAGSLGGLDPIYEVMLDAVSGNITGRLTGNVVIKPSTGNSAELGLRFMNMNGADTLTPTIIGSSILAQKSATNLALPAGTNLNLLMGIDPADADIGALMAKKPFLLLVYQEGGTGANAGRYTMLTSADPTAANYQPFMPDLYNAVTGAGGIAVRATAPLSLTDMKTFDLPKSANWALYGIGKPTAKAAAGVTPQQAFPRRFVGLKTADGTPKSFWANDGSAHDTAMTMSGSRVGVATKLGSVDPTLSSIVESGAQANVVPNAVALAWANGDGGADGATATLGKIFVAQATGAFVPVVTAPAPTLGKGWSLVTVPTGGTLNTNVVDAVIKVGAQVGAVAPTLTAEGTKAGEGTGQFTWFAVDGTPMPTLTAGEAVFVHAKVAGAL